jgi:hypothetical protein
MRVEDMAGNICQTLGRGVTRSKGLAMRSGLMDSARHVTGWHSTHETRVQYVCIDVAST